MTHSKVLLVIGFLTLPVLATAEDDLATLEARGKALYFERVSCWVCHGDKAEGRVGRSLLSGPTPVEIQEQLDSNPQMGVIVSELKLNADDLVALSVFINGLAGKTIGSGQIVEWRSALETMLAMRKKETVFSLSSAMRLAKKSLRR